MIVSANSSSNRSTVRQRLALEFYDRSGLGCVLLEPGMTLGRAPGSAIRVDHCDVCAVHASIQQGEHGMLVVRTNDPRFALTCEDGVEALELELGHGTTFSIGSAHFHCAEVRAIETRDGAAAVLRESGDVHDCDEALDARTPASGHSPVVLEVRELPVLRIDCPRCRADVMHLPPRAHFCPRCGLDLPVSCPPWNWSRDSTSPPSAATVRAYLNALFNLGVRFEISNPSVRDIEQAIRYYRKAARLGSLAARARLGEPG